MKHPFIWLVITVDLLALVVLAFVYPSAMVSPGALQPAHAALASRCFACHAPLRGAQAERCIACHPVVDIGVRLTSGAPAPARGERAISTSFHGQLLEHDCAACHREHSGEARRAFTHALLRPELRERCAGCHTAPANDRHRGLGVSCGQCHSTEHWAPASFDHAALTPAALARCESCHTSPADVLHRQLTGGCAQCHRPTGWRPSTFDHARLFVLDGEHDAACATCHPGNDFKRYTCFGCHEHTPANIRAEHEEEGVRDFDDCVACHRSGDDDDHEEGRRGGEH